MPMKCTLRRGGNRQFSRKNLFAFEENWMIFFMERARFGDLEIFLKFKIRIAVLSTVIPILAFHEGANTRFAPTNP
jgi:hypothetical protein